MYSKIYKLAEEIGFKFFPCFSTKAPATKNGFYDATNNVEKLKALFHRDDYLVGFPCGNANFGVVVVDFDLKDGNTLDILLEEIKNFGDFPDNGFSVQTPSGGRHYYFVCPEGVSFSGGARFFDKHLSIDVRATGQYVIFPDDRNYFALDSDIDAFYKDIPELPSWIANFKKKNESEQSGSVSDGNKSSLMCTPSEIREIRSALAYIDADDRDLWIKTGLALKSTDYEQGFALWDEWSKKSQKYNPSEMEYRWKTLKPNNVTIASLFYEAQSRGWVTTYTNETPSVQVVGPEVSDERKKEIQKLFIKKPFPEDLLNPPGLVGDIMRYIMETSIMPQPVFALSTALSAVGALAGRKVQTERGLRTNIYCLNVGASGCGKEAPRKAVKTLFNTAGCGHISSVGNLASDVAIVTELSKPRSESQVFLLDEIGRFLEVAKNGPSHLSGVLTVLLQLYSSADQIYYGKSYADSEKKKEIIQPNLCLLGTTTPETLYKGLTYESATDGFLSRMMIFETDDNRPKKDWDKNLLKKPDKFVVEQVKALYNKKVNSGPAGNLDHLNPQPQIVTISEDALSMLRGFDDFIYDLRVKLHDEQRMNATYNRCVQMAEQIALIIATGINSDSPKITEQEMGYSINLSNYLADQMHFIIENYMAQNTLEQESKKVLNFIRQAGVVSHSALVKKTQHLTGNTRQDIIDALLEAELIGPSYQAGKTKNAKTYIAL